VLRRLRDVRDSKILPPSARAQLFTIIIEACLDLALGWVSHRQIDRDGMASANQLALERAVRNLKLSPDAVLIDHFHLRACAVPQSAVDRGDSLSLSIASAAIVAKVIRDAWMEKSAPLFPAYGFDRHKGYGTHFHREMLHRHGPCAIHRLCFQPLTRLDDTAPPPDH
jgi:ribonuclease HII